MSETSESPGKVWVLSEPTSAQWKISPEECEVIGGHCFERTGVVLASNPPQYPEVCKHCGKRRVGIPREPFEYRYDN